jgi:hypothetical protein
MAIIKNIQQQMLVRIQVKRNFHTLLVEMYTHVTTMGISMEIDHRSKNKPFDPATPLLGIYLKEYK